MSNTPQGILSRLSTLEANLCLALVHADSQHIQDDLVRFSCVEADIVQLTAQNDPDPRFWVPIASAVQRIQAIADSFAQQTIKLSQRKREIAEDVEDLFQTYRVGGAGPSNASNCLLQTNCTFSTDGDASDQSLNAVVMRRWMLDHIEHPFPTTQDKEAIAEETNHGSTSPKGQLRPEQATLWFINSRRRSGWTQWARRFGNSDKARLRDIVAAIQKREKRALAVEFEDPLESKVEANDFKDRSLTKKELAHLCRTEFNKVTEWIEQGSKEKVGDWMDKVVAEARETLKRTKRERRAARKLVDERVRGRAAAATAQDGTDSSEDESAREQPFHQLQLNRRPIRQLPQQRHASGASSSSSGLSSVVSGGLYHHSGTSSSAATSLDSFYESGALTGQPAMHMEFTCPNKGFQQLQVTDHRPYIAASSVALHPTFTSSGLQQYQRGDVAQDFKTEQMAFVPHHSPSLAESARLNQEHLQFCGTCQPPTEQHPFFMPAVAAAAALGNNWGMPVSTLAMDSEMAEQMEEPVDYGGWLAWSGQMAGA